MTVQIYRYYAEIVHVDAARRGLAISTRSRAFYIRSAEFSEPGMMEGIRTALRARVAALPDGADRLSRMDEIDRLESRRRPKLAVCRPRRVLKELRYSYRRQTIFECWNES